MRKCDSQSPDNPEWRCERPPEHEGFCSFTIYHPDTDMKTWWHPDRPRAAQQREQREEARETSRAARNSTELAMRTLVRRTDNEFARKSLKIYVEQGKLVAVLKQVAMIFLRNYRVWLDVSTFDPDSQDGKLGRAGERRLRQLRGTGPNDYAWKIVKRTKPGTTNFTQHMLAEWPPGIARLEDWPTGYVHPNDITLN